MFGTYRFFVIKMPAGYQLRRQPYRGKRDIVRVARTLKELRALNRELPGAAAAVDAYRKQHHERKRRAGTGTPKSKDTTATLRRHMRRDAE